MFRRAFSIFVLYKAKQGNIAKAVEYFNKALAIDLDIFGESHSNVARDHNNLRMIYPEQGKLNKAAGIY
ncbi:tetratricopeptide repeat protein [Neochlamydia sp. S13]|uniref:tetratricopeptide repeat protein n=1 Tax=Neochlamydia sp. S13 TaxID=1353976 RepID=UPI0034CE9478